MDRVLLSKFYIAGRYLGLRHYLFESHYKMAVRHVYCRLHTECLMGYGYVDCIARALDDQKWDCVGKQTELRVFS